MNQEKIGKFIAKIRKEKNLTQKDVAEHLNVSINAVSKWERGICMMDISLLKPLSMYLGVSITEIINGEAIEDDTLKMKSDQAINSTLDYSQNTINKQKKKIKWIILGIGICICIASFLCYKAILCRMYESDFNAEAFQTFAEGLNNQGTMTIYKRMNDEENYLQIKDVKIRNDFQNFERIDGENKLDGTKFIQYDDKRLTKLFSVGSFDTYIDLFMSEATFFNILNSKHYNSIQKETFLKKYDIHNDIDFFQFISKYKYKKNTLFTSIDEMKESYALNLYLSAMSFDLKKFTIINGDYIGYIFEVEDGRMEVNILRNDKRYCFLFWGEELSNYNYIRDFLSSIEIE